MSPTLSLRIIVIQATALSIAVTGWLMSEWQRHSAETALDAIRFLAPGDTIAELERKLGRVGSPQGGIPAGSAPAWSPRLATFKVGVTYHYTIGLPPRLIMVHFDQDGKLDYVAWEPT